MPPIREHGVVHEEFDDEYDDDNEGGRDAADDDDDMPGLVDQPPSSMTYTFFAEMTPLSFDPSSASAFASASNPDLSLIPAPFSFSAALGGPSDQPAAPPPPRTSHGKRRDASYIPRPPNAFILFRSSFIRSQQVTGKVEGNHSNLSKIIGMYWKTLPKEERDEWEAKAALAQLEHRKRYPDWRFRPGANALAKLKVKDGGGAGPSRQRRIRNAKDPPDGGGEDSPATGDAEEGEPDEVVGKGKARARARSVRGRGKAREEPGTEKEKEKAAKAKAKAKSNEDTRFAKIADLLTEGKKGVELEIAVKEWEGGRKGRKRAKRDSSPSQEEGPSSEAPPSRVGTTSCSDAATASPTLSIAPPATHSPLSIWSVPTTSTPATPDTDDLPSGPRPRLHHRLHHYSSYPRSRSRSPPQSQSQSRSRSPVDLQDHHQDGSCKRSLSAPASHHRLAYPRPPQAPSFSLPLPPSISPAEETAFVQAQTHMQTQQHLEGGRRRRVRHRASASVSFSMDHLQVSPSPVPTTTGGNEGRPQEGYQYHPRLSRSPLVPHREQRRDTVSFPVSSPLARQASQPAMHGHAQTPPHPQTAPAYYHPHLHPRPQRLTWQQEEDRRRMEVEQAYAYWWRHDEEGDSTQAGARAGVGVGMYEPVREGSFEFDAGAEAGTGDMGYAVSGVGAQEGMDAQYLEQFPPLAHGHGEGESAPESVQWAQVPGRVGLVAPSNEPDTNSIITSVYGNSSSSPTLSVSPQQYTPLHTHAHVHVHALAADTNTSADVDPGGYFYPLPATPISPLTPYSSTFSSLAGWDGEAKKGSDTGATLSSSSGQDRIGASAGGGHPGGGPWYTGGGEWGGVQGAGLQGGREWSEEGMHREGA